MNTPSMQDLLEAGVHFGHQTRRGNPRMSQYIFGVRDGVHIINLEDSEKLLKEACEYVHKLGQEGKVLLFVGTKKQAQQLIADTAAKSNAPFVNYRWLGGTLTNFDELRRNIKRLLDIKEKKEKGELGHYTKKELLLIDRKLGKFNQEIGGLAAMNTLPDALFLVDAADEKTALKEATRLGIPVVAITDTNSNPDLVDKPIPGNDDASKSIKILVEAIGDAYAEGLGKAKVAAAAKKEADEKAAEAPVVDDATVAAIEQEVEKEEVKDAERVV